MSEPQMSGRRCLFCLRPQVFGPQKPQVFGPQKSGRKCLGRKCLSRKCLSRKCQAANVYFVLSRKCLGRKCLGRICLSRKCRSTGPNLQCPVFPVSGQIT
ncbi:hypothetical protein GPALN_014436, partial [Globodera pallida]